MAQTLSSKEFQKNKVVYLGYIKGHFGEFSGREMARRLNVGKTTIDRYRKELGLEIAKNTVNEGFFKTFSREMSYLLGFIITDGNVAWNPDKSYWSLTNPDRKRLRTFGKNKKHIGV